MDADTILTIKPALTRFLHEFDDCMGRVTNRGHLQAYVTGQLGPLKRKSVEPMADAAGVPPRTLQEFLSLLRWDEAAVRDRLQRRVARRHAHPHSIGILDETSFPKKGRKTACVQRQHCGALGKIENCVVSVHLGYVADDFHTLLDGELYLPQETWHADRYRCHEAGISDDVVYEAKWRMALEQVRRALANGVRFAWLTFDEGYGGKPPFLRGIDAVGLNYVAEIPVRFVGWTKKPDVTFRRHARDIRRGAQAKRVKVCTTSACEVRNLLAHSPVFHRQAWMPYRIKEGQQGPVVWEAKQADFWIKDEAGLPLRPHRLIAARNVFDRSNVKFFLSNAPVPVPVGTLLKVAMSRWRIERMFQDSKGELGMDHFEVRKYGSIQRHLILSCVSHLFLSEWVETHRGKKSGPDRLPGPRRRRGPRTPVVSWGPLFETTR